MAKYTLVELNIKNKELQDIEKLSIDKKKALKSSNAIYIYRGAKTKKIYIGQTTNFIERHKSHYSDKKYKFNQDDFDKVIVIFSIYFNRSALDDVEGQLITYFIADNSNKGKDIVSFDNVNILNRKGGNNVNEYIDRENIASDIIIPLWEKELYERKWVTTSTLMELRNSQLVKYSPIKILTTEQSQIIDEILNNKDKNYVINCDAGTGKTVLLTHLVAKMLDELPNAKIGVVVQPNFEKTAINIFKVYGKNEDNLYIGTSTKIIQKREKYDIIIVDEAHKLSRNYSKQHATFREVYKIKEFENCNSHLEILQKIGTQIVLMYDVLQAIRPANIQREMFKKLTCEYEKKFLTTQFRIKSSKDKKYGSEDYINGIKYLLYKDTGLLESGLTNYNPNFNKDVFKDKSEDAYFGYYNEKLLKNLIEYLEEDNNLWPEHINRVLSGLVEPWKQKDGKNPEIKHFHEDDIHLRWNSTQENWLNSKDLDAFRKYMEKTLDIC